MSGGAMFTQFRYHQGACQMCARVVLDRTATWANACRQGAVMLKAASARTVQDIRQRDQAGRP